ncbi:MAG: glutamate formimidoyltransferase [Flavobacteriales bacterium]|nr:glutamate formimidoyltransferase [Flavobacteriales bacterium]
MEELVECVPNFSEGRDQITIAAIERAIKAVNGVYLLHTDSGVAANRTVYTFVGSAEAVIEAAFQGAKVAAEMIDMEYHGGEHPRMGALDVCPFVPISGISKKQLIPMVEKFGKRLNEELGIPVFFYEDSAKKKERRNLANHRSGGYEQLEERMKKSWKADIGKEFNPTTGGTVCGVRDFLLAFNMNLTTKSVAVGKEIAYSLRESGWPKSKSKNAMAKRALRLKAVKSIAWHISDFDKVQVSVNLIDYHTTPLWKVFESCKMLAEESGTEVSGAELIGLVTLEAILDCGKHFNKDANATEAELVQSAIETLGLDELAPFDPQKRILEYRMKSI